MKKVLLIDDDHTVRRLVASLLRRKEFVVSQAADGEEATTLLANTRRVDGKSEYDLVLLDLAMPKLSGWGVLAFIERFMPEMIKHVVVISAEVESRLRELENRGLGGTLRKPFDVEVFYERIAGCTRGDGLGKARLKRARRSRPLKRCSRRRTLVVPDLRPLFVYFLARFVRSLSRSADTEERYCPP